MRNIKKEYLLPIIIIGSFLMASCEKPSTTYEDFNSTSVVFFNAYPVSTVVSVNLFMDTLKLTPTAIPYAGSTGTLVVLSGNDRLTELKSSATSQDKLATLPISFAPNTFNTIYLTGTTGAGEIIQATDDLTPAPNGRAKIRTVHLSPDLTTVDFLIKDGASLSVQQAYKAVTKFALVDTGTYVFQVKDSQTSVVKASTSSTTKIKLKSTECYTLLARGLSTGSRLLTLQVINDLSY